MRNCFVCGGWQKDDLFNSSVAVPYPHPLKGEQKIARCVKCGFIFSDSENTQEDYRRYYETLNKHKRRAADAAFLDRSYYDKIINFLGPLKKDVSILDFGSGDLLMKSVLLERGFDNVTTFDVDEGLGVGRRFDLITATHVFEHILDGDGTLSELLDYLKNSGQLLLSVPDVEGYSENYCGAYNWFDLEHINHFSKTSLGNFLMNKSLSIVRCVRDRREVRPGLFYPEVIVHCVKDGSLRNKPREDYKLDDAGKVIGDYLGRSERDFVGTMAYMKREIKSQVVIWGIGITAMRLIYHFDFHDVDSRFVDSNPLLQGKTINGRKIISPEELEGINLDSAAVIFVAAVNYKDILKSIPRKFNNKVRLVDY